MVLLPRGITGFSGSEETRNAGISPTDFKQMVYAMAVANQMTVSCTDVVLTGKNFFWAVCQKHEKMFFLLMNSQYPYLAFADQVEFSRVHFTEPPRDFVLPSNDELFILSPKLLHRSWREYGDALSSSELSQIQYWGLLTVGDIVFNFWD